MNFAWGEAGAGKSAGRGVATVSGATGSTAPDADCTSVNGLASIAVRISCFTVWAGSVKPCAVRFRS